MFSIRHELGKRNKTLHDRAMHLIAQSNLLTPHAVASFPTGTDHGPEHTATVERIGDMVLGYGLADALTDFELFYLLLAFYFHDLGMVGEESLFSTAGGREEIRRGHAVAIGTRLAAEWERFGFASQREAEVLGDICRGHRPARTRDGHADWNQMVQEAIVAPGESVKLRALSALIYGIDELHLDHSRAGERLQNWIKLKTPESKRHWMRHQAITGPTQRTSVLAFSATPKTLAFEEDLRRHVFSKAFGAYHDMKQALIDSGIEGTVPSLELSWDRRYIWNLLVIESEKAGRGASVCEIADDVTSSLRKNGDMCPLESLCVETHIADHEVQMGIRRAIDDYLAQNVLVQAPDSEGVCLSTGSSASHTIESVLSEADTIDRLFVGVFRAAHQFSMYREEYGARFVREQLQPFILEHYGIDVGSVIPDDFDGLLVHLLCVSPSAARLVRALEPVPSDLIKRRLLSLAVITGVSRDMFQEPALILNARTRRALYKVSEVLRTFDVSYAFIEEMSLLSAFTYRQIGELLFNSPKWSEEVFGQQVTEESRLTITQTLKPDEDRPSAAFPYLLLAGRRSGAGIQLRCNYGRSITVDVPTALRQGVSDAPPIIIGVGPMQKTVLPQLDLRCSVEVDKFSNQVTLVAFRLDHAQARQKPIILRLPTPAHAKEGESSVQVALSLPDLTVGDIAAIEELRDLGGNEQGIELQVVLGETGERLATLLHNKGASLAIPTVFDSILGQRLTSADRNLPVPWFCTSEHEEAIANASESNLSQTLSRIASELESTREEIPTFRLLIESEDGIPYREEFLRFAPGLTMSPPKVEPSGKYSQEEIDRLWRERSGEFKLETYVREDIAEVADSFRKWAKEESLFPVNIDSSIPTFHQSKTVFSIELHPRIDRFWYWELPNTIRLRPTTRKEQLETERRYWESVKDEDRRALVEEKIAKLGCDSL